MVGDRRRRNPAHRNNLAATHLLAAGNGLKDAQPRLIAQRFGNLLDLRAVHFEAVSELARSLANCTLSRY